MIKTLKNLLKQDKERYTVPRKVQDVIPVRRIWKDGIFQVGGRFSKTYQFTDINYLVASREDKEQMFLAYSELLNSLDSGATTKITINNRRLNRANFEQSILMPMRGDACDVYRREYNQMLLDKTTGANGIIQEKYITVSVCKKDIEEARTYFSRVGADLIAHFAALGSKCTELDAAEKLRVLHDFYRQGEEAAFHFDPQDILKTRVVDAYLKELRKDYTVIEYVGIAADEPKRIKDKTYPLAEWGMTEKDCLAYCYEQGFDWGGLYEIFHRVSCWCCPLQSLDELRKLHRYFPDLWRQLETWDDATWRTFIKGYSARDLAARFDFEEQWQKAGGNIRSRAFYAAMREEIQRRRTEVKPCPTSRREMWSRER